MALFKILHAFNLKSAGVTGTLMQPGRYFTTENDAQVAELQVFAKDGACEEIKSAPAEAPKVEEEKKTVDPVDDISVVPGVGNATVTKLAKEGITSLSHLKSAMADQSKLEQMKTLLGLSYDKVLKYFEESK